MVGGEIDTLCLYHSFIRSQVQQLFAIPTDTSSIHATSIYSVTLTESIKMLFFFYTQVGLFTQTALGLSVSIPTYLTLHEGKHTCQNVGSRI